MNQLSDLNSLLEVSIFLNIGFWAFKEVRNYFGSKFERVFSACENFKLQCELALAAASGKEKKKKHTNESFPAVEALRGQCSDILEDKETTLKNPRKLAKVSGWLSALFGVGTIILLFFSSFTVEPVSDELFRIAKIYIVLSISHVGILLLISLLIYKFEFKALSARFGDVNKLYKTQCKEVIDSLITINTLNAIKAAAFSDFDAATENSDS